MAINYTSDFTGQHNDEYDERITALLNTIETQNQTIANLQSNIITLNNNITTLSNQIAILNSNIITTTTWTSFSNVSTKISGFYNQKIIQTGRIVSWSAQFKAISDFSNGDLMFYMPSGVLKPLQTQHFMSSNLVGTFSYAITIDGIFIAEVVPAAIKAGDWCFVCGSYVSSI